MMEGGCECGAVRFRLTDAPVTVNCCHCRDCQRVTGSAFALNAMVETDRIRITRGAPMMRSLARAGQADTRAWHCATCGTLLWADHPFTGDAARFVRVGTLDRAEALEPDAHYFVRSRHAWVTVPPGVAAFDTLPGDDAGIDLPPDRAARMAALTTAAEQPGA